MSTSDSVALAQPPLGLRERTRLAVQVQITDLACTLFTEQGFAVTTVEQIAGAAGLSRRSFFRYFGSKEEVLLATFDQHAAALVSALAARPDDEPLWPALRRTLDVVVIVLDRDPAGGLRLMRLILSNPALAAGFAEKLRRWHDALVPDAAARLASTTGGARLAASTIIGAALAAFVAAVDDWVTSAGAGAGTGTGAGIGTVAERLDRAFADLSSTLSHRNH